MTLVVVGLNHRTAPVAVRERFALHADKVTAFAERLVAHPSIDEAAVVSTCNRTEIVAVSESAERGIAVLGEFFESQFGSVDLSASSHFFRHVGADAVRHVFRVASSLDSMVVGEAQILGQMKQAYHAANRAGACGPILNRLFHRAFRTAKRVRTETGLGGTSISLARVGVQLARQIFESFADKRVLLVGAGEMAESALHGFHEAGVRKVVVINRTLRTAEALADRFGGRASLLSALDDELESADVVLTSVGVDRPLLDRAAIEACLARRQGRSLLMIDLGLPRNVDPAVQDVDDVYLYDIDDLDAVAERGRAERRAALGPAEAIVALELERFERWQAGLEAVPLIRDMLDRAHATARREVERALGRLSDGADERTRAEMERLAGAIVAKLMHRPVEHVRREASEQNPPYYADAVRDMFGLEEDDE